MVSAEYQEWTRAGRPVTGLIRPLQRLRDTLRRYGYTVYDLGDESHLTHDPPEDHSPFSATGWPVPTPHWWITAIDVMPPPTGKGLPTLQQLGARIYTDRQAGLFSSLKYLNWEPDRDWGGACWHDSWQPDHVRRASSDRGHIHLSGRSDRTTYAGDDDYDPVARIRGNSTEDDLMAVADTVTFELRPWTAETLQTVRRLEAGMAAEAARDAALRAVVDALAAALQATGGSVDSAAVINRINEVAAAESTTVTALRTELAQVHEEVARLRQAAAAAAKAQTDTLGG